MPATATIVGVDDAAPFTGSFGNSQFINDPTPGLNIYLSGASVGQVLSLKTFFGGPTVAPNVTLTADDISRGFVHVDLSLPDGEYAWIAQVDGVTATTETFVFRVATAAPQTPYIRQIFDDSAGAWVAVDDHTTDSTPVISVYMPGISNFTAPPPPGHPPFGNPSPIVGGTVELLADGVVVGSGFIGAWGNVDFTLSQALDAGDHAFTVRAVDKAGNRSPLSSPITFTILDPDAPPPAADGAVTLSGSGALAEGNSGLTAYTYTLTRTGDISGSAMIDYWVWGPNVDAADFSGPTAGTAYFAAGDSVKTITINVVGDTLAEGDESFDFNLSNPRGATLLGPTAVTATIIDDDAFTPPPPPPPPEGSTIIGLTAADEGDGGAMLTFTVSRTGDLTGQSIVDWWMWGEAEASDFTGPTAGSVYFLAGETEKTIVLHAASDAPEPAESFTLFLSNPRGGDLGATTSLGAVIGPDDLFT